MGPDVSRELTAEEIRRLQLRLLDVLDDVCTKEGIPYYLAGGTLLGAVRHSGYIPWDDDIDLMMTRPDICRLEKVLDQLNSDCVLHGPDITERWTAPYFRLCDLSTVWIEHAPSDVIFGVNIEIFPIDGVSASRWGRFRQRTRLMTYQLPFGLWRDGVPSSGPTWKRPILIAIHAVSRRLRGDRLAVAVFHQAGGIDPKSSGIAGELVHRRDQWFPFKALDPPTRLEFEGREYWAPARPDVVLTAKYGPNFMTPPAEHLRRTHHTFTAHWLNVAVVRQRGQTTQNDESVQESAPCGT